MGNDELRSLDVLRSARQMLEFAKLGASDFEDAGERRLTGLFNAVTSGRSVTFVLQKLRGRADGFESWYQPVQQRLKDDPAARWFVELRNRIEKEGTHGPTEVHIEARSFKQETAMQNAPANCVGMFIGDSLGRSGWIVRLADGTEAPVFTTVPGTISRMHILDAPGGHPVELLLPQWLRQLENIVADAESRFGGAPR